MNKKGYTMVELIAVIAVFSIGYFITVGIISNKINVNYDEKLYEQKIDAIETQAALYAQGNEELFKDSNSIYLTIDDLAKADAIISNKDGVVIDPRDNGSLNDVKVKITNKDSKITAKVLS